MNPANVKRPTTTCRSAHVGAKQVPTSCQDRSPRRFVNRLTAALCLLLMSGASLAQLAQATTTPESEREYKSCPDGYYNGPRPGRRRYTEDPWIWVVSPRFAQRYCFPAEFVSTELKGAEAVAVRLEEDRDEVICGWGGNTRVCRPSRVTWRFELYVTAGTLPKDRDVRYFHAADLPSKMMITRSEQAFQEYLEHARKFPRVGALSPMKDIQAQLAGTKGGRLVWGMGNLAPNIYYAELLKGIDYLSVSTLAGGLNNARALAQGIDGYVIAFLPPQADASMASLPLAIELPTHLIDRMRGEDARRKKELLNDVLRATGR